MLRKFLPDHNSHSKRSNRGMFYTVSGKHIPYHYVDESPEPLLRGYAYEGTVRVLGQVRFDADLEPQHIDIRDIRPSQQRLDFDPPDPTA